MKEFQKSIILLALAVAAVMLAGCSISPGSKGSYGGAVGSVVVPADAGTM